MKKKSVLEKWLLRAMMSATICVYSSISFSQYISSVNVVLQPPYSGNYTSYENLAGHAIITITGGIEPEAVYLTGRLTNNQTGLTIFTKNNYIGPRLQIPAHQPVTIINDVQRMGFLHRNNVSRGGVGETEWLQLIRDGALPEGQYNLCVNVVRYNPSGDSALVLGSGCASFTISYAQAPTITTPLNGQELDPHLPNTVFSWTPPLGNTLGAQIVYDLYVVKVPQGQNPNDAMNVAVNYKANNPIIKTNLTGNQYVTQPYDLKIDTGELYAVQVVARDVAKKVSFKNNGRSEVVVFWKGKVPAPIMTTGITPIEHKNEKTPTPGSYKVTNTDPVPVSQIKGKLYYRFKDQKSSAAANQSPSKDQLNKTVFGALSDDNLTYNKETLPVGDAQPLAGKRISLVIVYIFSGESDGNTVNGAVISSASMLPGNAGSTIEKVLATTTTASDGSFTFDFVNTEKDLGLWKKGYSYNPPSIKMLLGLTGNLYKVLRIRVEDKYYLSPDVNIKIAPWEGTDLGTVISYVKSYSLKVKVTTVSGPFWDMAYGQGTGLPGISTAIFRKTIFPSIPSNEGAQHPKAGGSVKVNPTQLINKSTVAGASKKKSSVPETDKDEYITFHHLVQHDPDNKSDRYYIKCTPDPKKGNFIFKEETQSYYPRYNESPTNYPFNTQRSYNPHDPSPGALNLPMNYGSNITWNSEFEMPTFTTSIELYPLPPRIAGKLRDATNIEAKPMANKNVVMFQNYVKISEHSRLVRSVTTNGQGRYAFDHLDLEFDTIEAGKMSSVIGPTRTIIAKPDGYKAAVLPGKRSNDSPWKANQTSKTKGKNCDDCYPPLKWGQQLVDQDFFLTPDGKLEGYVTDEDGNAVAAEIDVDGMTKTTTQNRFIFEASKPTSGKNKLTITGSQAYFTMLAPSGKRKITIEPTNEKYAKIDTILTIQKDNKNIKAIKFVVPTLKKRIRFKIAEIPPGYKGTRLLPGIQSKGIPGVKVSLMDSPIEVSEISDKDGYVTLTYDNMAADFIFKVEPPENLNFEERVFSLSNIENSITTITLNQVCYLKPATEISGTVTVGPDKKPLEGATVSIDLGNGKSLSASTDKNGKYVLKKVPKSPSKRTVQASKPGAVPNLITSSQEITIKDKNELDFNLINDNELVIRDIFGFEVEVTEKKKQDDGTWLINGNLINLKDNNNFSLQDHKLKIPFHNLKIKKSGETINGIPVAIPETSSLTTDLAGITLKLHQNFIVEQLPSSGDQLQVKAVKQNGSLTGKVALKKSSFTFSSDYLTFNSDASYALLLTDKPGSSGTEINTIESGSGSPKNKFGIADIKGKSLSFNLLGFDASAESKNSWIQDKTLNIQTTLHVKALPAMSPSTIDINAGNLVVHTDKLEPLKSDQPIKFKLEKWEFTGNSWQLAQNDNSINIPTGTMKTGSVDVPLNDISLKPDHLRIGGFDVTNLTMAGVVPIEVITKSPVFGYNKSTGKDQGAHYEFSLVGEDGQAGVVIKGLPGMKSGDAMKFQNFSLISNGDQILNPGNQPNDVTFYSVMKVRPLAFTSGDNYVNMDCGIDMGIPQLDEMTGIIQFSKEAGKTKFMLYPLNVSLKGPGGVGFTPDVQFTNQPQQLSEGKFTALGTIHDKEGIVLKGILTKTTNAAWIQVDPENQKLSLGGNNTGLADIKGKMEANMQQESWNNFTFSGTMKGFKGMQGDTRKTFTVTGSINASNEKIDVKNIPSSFGNIGITYDIANSRFIGNLQLDKQIGPLRMSGTANMLVDAGGWYFLARGLLQTPGLGELSAGLLIGDYNSMPADVSQNLMKFAYDKSVPPSFKNGISGFFFTGMKDLPLGIPNFSINLGILSASFGAQAGLDARLWMDFAKSGNEYGIGAMVFAHAYLKGASITCTKFGADARAELGLKGTYSSASGTFALNGCGSFTISGSIQQCVPAPCWSDGICCKYCGGVSTSAGIKINILLDSNGNTDLSFGFGNCSGQTPMTGNW